MTGCTPPFLSIAKTAGGAEKSARARPKPSARRQQCIYETNSLPGYPGCVHYTARAPPASTNKHAAARRTPPTCNFFLQVAAAWPVSMFQKRNTLPTRFARFARPVSGRAKNAQTAAAHARVHTRPPPQHKTPSPRPPPRRRVFCHAKTPKPPQRQHITAPRGVCKCIANARRFCMQMHCKKCITRPREEIQKKID